MHIEAEEEGEVVNRTRKQKWNAITARSLDFKFECPNSNEEANYAEDEEEMLLMAYVDMNDT